MLNLAVPIGSIGPGFESLMSQAGMSVEWQGYEGYVESSNIKIKVIQLRPQDSPLYVARGCVDACVTGEDCLKERLLENELIKVAELPITRAGRGTVSLVLFVRRDSAIEQVEDLSDYERVATEYPNITRQYLAQKNIRVDIDVSHGRTEALVASGFVAAGVDITDTGNSLKANKLRIVDVVMQSTAVLVANPRSWSEPAKKQALENVARLLLQTLNQERMK